VAVKAIKEIEVEKVIRYCAVKNRWVGMVFYPGGMVKKFFITKPKLKQLNGICETARRYIAIDADTGW